MSFVKLYGSILHSSIWLENHTTRIVWITLLAMADARGIVEASVGGLAHAANVTRAECEAAIASLTSPDPDSRTPDNEGRRIEPVDGGWLVLNREKYRDRRTDAQVSAADRVRRFRAKRVTCNAVTHSNDAKRTETEKETEKETEAYTEGVQGGTPPSDPPRARRRKKAADPMSDCTPEEHASCEVLLAHLSAAVRQLRPRSPGWRNTAANRAQLLRRLRDGTPPETIREVIDARAAECARDKAQIRWLDPVTPFRDANWPRSIAAIGDDGTAERPKDVRFGHMFITGDEVWPEGEQEI